MTPQRIFGFILLALGIIGVAVGISSSHSMVDQLSNTFTGHFTDRTTWFFVAGIASGIVGFSLLMLGSRGRNSRNS
jgi:hypothetical protein